MGTNRLTPTLFDRLHALMPAGHGARVLWTRRIAATLLICLAAALAFHPPPATGTVPVLVAARDLPPGHVLARADVVQRAMPSGLVPGGALRDVANAEGRTLSGGSRAGEPVTDVRLASPALTRLTTADDTHAAVPIRLADPAVADLLYPGRRVDVITADSGSGRPVVLAERVPVLATGPVEDRHGKGRLLIVGLPQQQAATVASAALTQSVTITLR